MVGQMVSLKAGSWVVHSVGSTVVAKVDLWVARRASSKAGSWAVQTADQLAVWMADQKAGQKVDY